MEARSSSVIFSEKGSGERLGSAAVLVATDDLMMSEYYLEPGSEPRTPHYHARHADSFFVLEGEPEFQIDGRTLRAKSGSVLVAPRGAVHAFSVAIGSPARFLNLHTPGIGFERYLRELNALRSRGERPSTNFLRSHDIYEV